MRPHSPSCLTRPARHPGPSHASDGAPSDGLPPGDGAPDDEPALGWSFLSKHAHVLACVQDDPQIRIRELASKVGLSPRAVLRTLADLESAQYITRQRDRRGSRYQVHTQRARRSPVVGDLRIAELLQLLAGRAALVEGSSGDV